MNPYGRLAMDHMANWLPIRYAQIPDPEIHFDELGEAIALRIAKQWARRTPYQAGESPPEAVRRAVATYAQAQHKVLEAMAWPEPESPLGPDSEVSVDPDGAARGGLPGWIPESLDGIWDEGAWESLLSWSLGLDPVTETPIPGWSPPQA